MNLISCMQHNIIDNHNNQDRYIDMLLNFFIDRLKKKKKNGLYSIRNVLRVTNARPFWEM